MRAGFLASRSTRSLVLGLLLALWVQLFVLAVLFKFRADEVQGSTRALPPSQLLEILELTNSLSPADRQVLSQIARTPNLEVTVVNVPPNTEARISWYDRLLGGRTTRSVLDLDNGEYLVLNRRAALTEAYGFVGQVGVLILIFIFILALVLWRARAALEPVERFAEAADRLSKDLHAPAMAEDGGEELVQATQAVNRMQLALQEQVAERSRMIAGIGHDLRTYITRLTLRADLISDEAQRAKTLRDLEEMTAVVNQSLDLGRADQPTEPLQSTILSEFVSETIKPYMEQGQSVRLALIMPAITHIRPTALRRAIQNIVGNALRYGEEARVGLTVKGAMAHIWIEDRGPGIPKEQRDAVLKPYVRLEGSRNRDTGGTGLGLAVANALVRQQNGELWLLSARTGGLRVEIRLPIT